MNRIDGDITDTKILVEIAVGGDIPPPILDAHFDLQRTALTDGADIDVLVENLDIRIVFDIARGVDARLKPFQINRLAFIAVYFQRDLFQVENDVGRIFDDAWNRRELVQHTFDLHRGDRSALDRRQQHAAECVADRCSKSSLKRLR